MSREKINKSPKIDAFSIFDTKIVKIKKLRIGIYK